jgi:hypothetical protein
MTPQIDMPAQYRGCQAVKTCGHIHPVLYIRRPPYYKLDQFNQFHGSLYVTIANKFAYY